MEGNKSVKDATEQALSRCDGSWGLCVMWTDAPDQLVVARNGSPLVIGIGYDRTFIASETSAFNRSGGEAFTCSESHLTLKLKLKECVEQPEATARALGFGGRLTYDNVQLGGLEKVKDELRRVKYLTLSACGTSLNTAQYVEKLMKHLVLSMVHSLDAAEADSNDFPRKSEKAKEYAFLVVSQSGETKCCQRTICWEFTAMLDVRMPLLVPGHSLPRSLFVLALIALWFRELRGKCNGVTEQSAEAASLKESLMRLPICCGMALTNRVQCQQVAERLNDKDHCFILPWR
eukprot:scaffold26681_cov83-Skeletonema_marinoi.AAC.3